MIILAKTQARITLDALEYDVVYNVMNVLKTS